MSLRNLKKALLLLTLTQFSIYAEIQNGSVPASVLEKNLRARQEIVERVENSFDKDEYVQKGVHTIKASDIGRKGYVITRPGSYTVEGNIVFNPESPENFVPVKFKEGGGNGARGFALVSGGIVRGVAVTEGGSGYTSAPKADFGGHGEGASGYGGFSIESVTVTVSGTNYGFPIVIISGDGEGAQAVVSGQDGSGGITAITIINEGVGYSNATATIVDDNGTGTGATASVNLAFGKITGAVVTSGGSHYKDTVQAAITIKSSDVKLYIKDSLSQCKGSLASSLPNYTGANKPSSQVPYVVGILIPDPMPENSNVDAVGYESISITGNQAAIDGFSLYGIRVFAHTANIQISNLDVLNTGLLASYYLRPFPAYQPHGNPGFVTLNWGDYFTQTPGPSLGTEFCVAGICFGETDALGMGPRFFTQRIENPIELPYVGTSQNRISSVILKNVNCLNNYSFGFVASNVTDLYISGCHLDGTLTDDPQLWAIGGIFGPAEIYGESPNILNLVVENSTFNDNSMLGDYETEAGFGPLPDTTGVVSGNLVAFSQNGYFSNCHFDHSSATFALDQFVDGDGQQVFGSLNSANTDLGYDHCTFNDVSGLWGVSGWCALSFDQFANNSFTASRNNSVIDFEVKNIQSNTQNQLPAPFIGVLMSGMLIDSGIENLTISGGIISDIITNGPSGGAVGIELGQATNAVISNMVVQNVATVQGGNALGIFAFNSDSGTIPASTIAIDNCIVEGCLTQTPTLPYTAPPYNLTRGVAKAFNIAAGPAATAPISITNCKAINNKGLPNSGDQYSAGFRIVSDLPNQPMQCAIENCEATDNVYGFILISTSDCVIRNCRADFNVSDDGTNTGAGFTDVGTGTVASPGQSFSLFQSNSAYANGALTHIGPNGNYNINVDGAGTPPPLLEGQVSNPAGYTYVAPSTPELPNVRNVSIIP
jgi:parallel beta-helix repeat protein